MPMKNPMTPPVIEPATCRFVAQCLNQLRYYKALSTSKLDLNLRKKLVKFYTRSIAFYGAETWTLQKIDENYLESFETWSCRRLQKIRRNCRVQNDELHRIREERNILRT
jgi:hypothetical protein